jgi:hypothetical protein
MPLHLIFMRQAKHSLKSGSGAHEATSAAKSESLATANAVLSPDDDLVSRLDGLQVDERYSHTQALAPVV